MPEIHNTFIESSLSDALNTMAFISPMPPEDLTPPPEPALLTRIEFHGAAVGALELVCPPIFGAMLAANLLGPDSGTSDDGVGAADALRELLNVICGTMLRDSGVTGWGSVEMGVPIQRAFDLSGWNAFIDSGAVVVDADGSKLALRMIGCN